LFFSLFGLQKSEEPAIPSALPSNGFRDPLSCAYLATMNTQTTFETDNSSAALFVKNWMKQDNPRLDAFQLEQKWWQHRERINSIITIRADRKK
jgi:hypothetical protein